MTAATPDPSRSRFPEIPITRLCIIVAALAMIARARVAVLPGWVVPLPVLILAAAVVLCASAVAFMAWMTPHTYRTWTAPSSAPEAAS
jgi:fatty acid desaturase